MSAFHVTEMDSELCMLFQHFVDFNLCWSPGNLAIFFHEVSFFWWGFLNKIHPCILCGTGRYDLPSLQSEPFPLTTWCTNTCRSGAPGNRKWSSSCGMKTHQQRAVNQVSLPFYLSFWKHLLQHCHTLYLQWQLCGRCKLLFTNKKFLILNCYIQYCSKSEEGSFFVQILSIFYFTNSVLLSPCTCSIFFSKHYFSPRKCYWNMFVWQ